MFSGKQSNPEKKRYDRISFIYDWMEFLPEKLFMSQWRKQAIRQIGNGLIMELGVGTGKNLPNYPKGRTIIAVDISLNMIRKARNKVGESTNVQFALMNAEQLAFKENVFDNVFVTFVFCSVTDPSKGLHQLRQVLKPNGKVIFLEHVRPGSVLLGALFDLFNPIFVWLAGPNINRQTNETIENVGFQIEEEKNLLRDIVKLIIAK